MKKNEPQMLTTFVRSDNTGKHELPADFSAMVSLLTVLAVMSGMSVYYYGLRALVLLLVCVGSCWLLDVLCLVLRRRTLHIHDISPILTGLIIAVMMPATVPFTVAAAASAFAICIAKHPLGNHGKEIMSAAAAGYIFAELCWPSAVLSYPKSLAPLPVVNLITDGLTGSFTYSAMHSTSSAYTDFELLIGKFPGPMGCSFTILTLVCALYLISRKAVSGWVFFPQMITILGISMLKGGIFGVKAALAGGMVIFGTAVFSGYVNTAPKTAPEKMAFGIFSGLMTMAISHISTLENPIVYAAVLSAPFARLMGKPAALINRLRRAKKISRQNAGATEGGTENG